MKKHKRQKDVVKQQSEVGCVQKAVLASCKDLPVDEAIQKAKLFQSFNRDDFKIITNGRLINLCCALYNACGYSTLCIR